MQMHWSKCGRRKYREMGDGNTGKNLTFLFLMAFPIIFFPSYKRIPGGEEDS
jgi:hypothetical protein